MHIRNAFATTSLLSAATASESSRGFSLFAGMCSVLITLLITSLITWPRRHRLKKRCTADAIGVVVQERIAHRHPRLGNTLCLTILFQSCYGEDVYVRMYCDEHLRSYHLGEQVKLKYDPNDPQVFIVSNWS